MALFYSPTTDLPGPAQLAVIGFKRQLPHLHMKTKCIKMYSRKLKRKNKNTDKYSENE